MSKLVKRIFTTLLLVTVLAGSVVVQAESTDATDSTVLTHYTIETEKDLKKEQDSYNMVFGEDVKELTYPVEVTQQGILVTVIKETDTNYYGLEAKLYEDADCTKEFGRTLYLSSGEQSNSKVTEIKKPGTYYMKVKLNRKRDNNEQMQFPLKLKLIPNGIREIKKDIIYTAYQDYDNNDGIYKLSVNNTGLVTLNIGFTSETRGSAKITLLNSKKQPISKEAYTYPTANDDGTYSNEIFKYYALTKGTYYIKVQTSSGLYGLKYSSTPVADKSGSSLKNAAPIKLGGSAEKGICTVADKTTNVDCFKFTLAKQQEVNIIIDSKVDGRLKVEICDSNGRTVMFGSTSLSDGDRKLDLKSSGKWSKGTFYIKVYKYDKESSGSYSIKVK